MSNTRYTQIKQHDPLFGEVIHSDEKEQIKVYLGFDRMDNVSSSRAWVALVKTLK